MINPSAAASEPAREFDDLLSALSNTSFECGTWGTGGGEEDTEYLETLRKRDSAMEAARTRIASELSAKDREIEALTQDRNSWRRVAERLESEKTTARADVIRECVGQLQQLESPDYDHGTQANGFEDGKVAAIDTLESLLNEKDTK